MYSSVERRFSGFLIVPNRAAVQAFGTEPDTSPRRGLAAWARLIPWPLLAAVMALAAPSFAQEVTLEEAVQRALANHPDLRVAEAELRAAEGELRGARTYPFNPEVSGSGGRESNPGDPSRGSAVEFSFDQTLELGKRGPRISAAEARRAAAQARVDQVRVAVLAGARRAYLLSVAARDRVRTTREAESVADELRTFAAERLQLGAGTQLESNVAAAAAGRARADRLVAERRLRLALADLATSIAAPPGELPEPTGPFPTLPPSPGTLEEFVGRALSQRADLRAARHERLAAASDLTLAQRLAIPDPVFGVQWGRANHPLGEGSPQERTLLFGVTLPLPIFNRNQGGVAVARALEGRAGVVEQAQEKKVEREARATFVAYENAREAAEGFDREVVESLTENIDLARESFRAGKISLLEFNLLRRELVETRLSYLDALAELVEARFALELAAGGGVE